MNNKKKILVFIDWYLPGYKAGGPIQSCANIVSHLADNFEFSIVTSDTDYTEKVPYTDIVSNKWNSNGDVKVFYFSKEKLTLKNIIKLLSEEQYDIVYFNSLFSIYFTIIPLLVLWFKGVKQKIVLAPRGMFAEGALSIKPLKKNVLISVLKNIGVYKKVTFHASSIAEQNDIKRELGVNANVVVAPNLPPKIEKLEIKKRIKKTGELNLVYIARVAPEKNLKYVFEILSGVQQTVNFDIYGPVYEEKYFLECMDLFKSLPSNIIVKYKGALEKSRVKHVLENNHLLILPTLGENFGHVILESLTYGCPVLISNLTPWHDLESKEIGADYPLEKKVKFINFVETYCGFSQNDFDHYSEKSSNFARSFYDNKEVIEKNINLFEN